VVLLLVARFKHHTKEATTVLDSWQSTFESLQITQ
jgi:hypothetical protein